MTQTAQLTRIYHQATALSRRDQRRLAQMLLADLGDSAGAAQPEPRQADLRPAIRAAIALLARIGGPWVSMTALRTHLTPANRGRVDAALIAMVESGEITAIPESRQWLLTPADREAALWCGGQHKHLISLATTLAAID